MGFRRIGLHSRRTGFCATLAWMLVLGLASGVTGNAWAEQDAFAPDPESASKSLSRETVLLRISGDEIMAATIMAPLASNYLQRVGAQGISVDAATPPWTTRISGQKPDGTRVAVLVRSNSTEEGIRELMGGEVDIAMAGRPLTPDELRAMPPLPNSEDSDDTRESVAIARSAIIVVVNPINPVSTITFEQLRDIYSGVISNWAELGGRDAPIRVLAREKTSTSRQVFESVVLEAIPVTPTIEETLSFEAMREALRGDPNAIGYMGIADDLKVLRIQIDGHIGVSPPDSYELASGDYPLTLVLRLYRNPRYENPDVPGFFREALSVRSQFLILSAGLAELGPQLIFPITERRESAAYVDVTRNALRVSTTIRFADGSEEVDLGARHSLDLLARYLRVLQVRGDKLMLIAFSEDAGDAAKNTAISERLGQIVAAELERRLVSPGRIVPLGAEMPLANDHAAVGRGINRRVETWIRP